jgi:hypothetical protein
LKFKVSQIKVKLFSSTSMKLKELINHLESLLKSIKVTLKKIDKLKECLLTGQLKNRLIIITVKELILSSLSGEILFQQNLVNFLKMSFTKKVI